MIKPGNTGSAADYIGDMVGDLVTKLLKEGS